MRNPLENILLDAALEVLAGAQRARLRTEAQADGGVCLIVSFMDVCGTFILEFRATWRLREDQRVKLASMKTAVIAKEVFDPSDWQDALEYIGDLQLQMVGWDGQPLQGVEVSDGEDLDKPSLLGSGDPA